LRGIRGQLMLVALTLLAIPWAGYLFIQETETFLRQGQEQTLLGTARAIANLLQGRRSMFPEHAELPSPGPLAGAVYARALERPIQLDGYSEDWSEVLDQAQRYPPQGAADSQSQIPPGLSFDLLAGVRNEYLYLLLRVRDDKIVAGALPGGAVGGRADIVDMIAHRGDPEWDNQHRVYHPGTFNANPLSAVAGATCLEIIAGEPINQRADAMADRLKKGLNDVFARMEISGHAHGVASMIHLVLADCDCNRETCNMHHGKIKQATALPAVTEMKRGLLNHGVDIMGRDAFLVSATHTEDDIDQTLTAFEQTLVSVRAEGLL